MNPKFAIKVIRQGQTQKVNVVSPGAGQSGNALVLKATDASRYQISDVVTLTGPEKLNIKRVGADLHLALPGSDIDAPDVVIKDYFDVAGNVLQGQAISGEWMTYDTSALASGSSTGSWWSSGTDAEAGSQTAVSTLSSNSAGLYGVSWGAMAGLGAIGVGLAAGGGGSGGSSDSTPLEILKNYTNDSASTKTATKPTLSTYKELGIKAFTSLADTSEANRVELVDAKGVATTVLTADILNSALDKLSGSTLTKEKVQALADSYYRILKEADGSTTTNTDVYNDTTNDAGNAALYNDPTATDYANVGATVGSTTHSLSLLNDVVGRSAVAKVDTIDEINAMARAAENVMLQAKAATAAATDGPALYTTDAEWISGLAVLGITGVSAGMVADIKAKIAATADDGTGVDTYQELVDLLKPVVSAQILRNYSISSSNTTPTAADYENLGVKAFNSLADTAHDTSIGTGAASFLTVSILNTALDKLDLSSVTTEAAIKAKVQDVVDSYYRILSEADGVVNTTTNTDVYPATADSDPLASDYTNIGATVGNAKSIDLLNDFVGLSAKTAVDTVDEINTVAKAAYNVMVQAGVTAGAGTMPATYATDAEWVTGLTALGIAGVTASNIAAVKTAIAATASLDTASDGVEVDTVQEIKDLVSPIVALQVLKDYANATNGSGVTVPTFSTYKDAGIKGLTNLSETTASSDIDAAGVKGAMGSTWLTALNSALDKRTDGNTLTKAQVQDMVDSYYRILSEADGVVNTTTNTDVYPATADSDPLASDYTNIGATVGNAKSIDLLNDFVGLSAKTAVDTVDEINTVAKAAYNVMVQAGVTAGTGTMPAAYATDAEWVTGLTALGIAGVTASNIAAVKTAIAGHADGTAVDTVQEIKDLVSPIVALQVLKDYANATNGSGVTVPTFSTYKDAGIKGLTNLSETTASSDIDGAGVTGAMGSTWLTALNSALDKRTDGNTLTKAQVQDMVDSYYRILSEADGVVNTTTNTDVYPAGTNASSDDPLTSDYTNIGATVGNAKSIDLLNDFVGLSAKTAVDTVDEINTVAKAAYNVMVQAGVTAGTGNVPAIYTLDADWIAGLTALGVTGVTTSNIAAVKTAIAATASQGTANDGAEVDTVQEIKDLLKVTIAQQVLRDYTDTNGTSTAPTLTTYTDAGIKTFKSLADTGDANRKALNDSSTASGAESNTFLTAVILNTALDKLAGTGLTYDATYTGTVQKMVDSYYRILREADGKYSGDSNGGATYYNNSDAAHTADTDVYNDTINDATNATNYSDPTLADYANICVTVADAISTTTYNATTAAGNETLDLLNDAIGRLGNSSVDTVAEIETLATTANDVMRLAKVDAVQTLANTASVITANIAAAASQTDVNLITGLNNLLSLNTSTGANSNNIAAIKAAIAATADDGTGVNTADKLLGVLALVRLKDFTDDGAAIGSKTASTPTLNDWSAISGVTANTSLTDGTDVALNQATYWKTSNAVNGLNALNSALDTHLGSTVNTSLVQSIVDSYGRILQEADGSRATDTDVSKISDITSPVDLSAANVLAKDVLEQDLINVGVTASGTNDGTGTGLYYLKTGELLASSIGSLASTSVDTVGELNTLMGYAENVMKLAKGASVSYTDAQWVSALTGLGITGVNSSNITAIKSAIDGSTDNTTGDGTALDTYDELQAIVSLVRLNDYAALNTGYQTPTISDYQAIMAKLGASHYSDANSSYLNAYNDAVNGQSSITSDASVSTMVTDYNLVLAMADGNRNSTPTTVPNAAQYNGILGVSGVTGDGAGTVSYLLNSVIDGLNTSQVDSVAELTGLIATAKKVQDWATSIPGATTLGRTEMTNLGLTDGNGHTVSDINSATGTYWISDAELANFQNTQLKGISGGFTSADTWQELQNLMNAAILAA